MESLKCLKTMEEICDVNFLSEKNKGKRHKYLKQSLFIYVKVWQEYPLFINPYDMDIDILCYSSVSRVTRGGYIYLLLNAY